MFKQPVKTIISPIRVVNTYKSRNEIASKLLTQEKSALFPFCPFTIIMGIVNTTQSGYVGNNSIVNNYTSFTQVFTGREPILAEWTNCHEDTQIITPTTDPEFRDKQYWNKKFKVGDTFWGILEQDNIAGGTSGGGMVSFNPRKNIVLTASLNIEENKPFFESITNRMYNLFVLPKINIFDLPNIITQPQTILDQDDREFYRISNIEIVYNAEGKDPVWATITFSSVNDDFAKTGLAINQFVQLGAPGEPVCFPYWDATKGDVTIDPTLMSAKNGVTHAQIAYYGCAAISGISFMGRKIDSDTLTQDKDGNWIYRVIAPHDIIPYKFQPAIYDNLHFNAVPETNYFACEKAVPTVIEALESWESRFKAQYNPFAGEIARFEGYYLNDSGKTEATNVVDPITKCYQSYWDEGFLSDKGWGEADEKHKTASSPYFYANPSYIDKTFPNKLIGITDFVRNSMLNKSFGLWLWLNNHLMIPFTQLPTSLTQLTPMSLDQIPIIGSFLNKVTLGMNVGWGNNKDFLPIVSTIPTIVPCEMYEVSKSMLSTYTTIAGAIPFDFLKNSTTDTPASLFGTTTHTSALCFNLTHFINIKPTLFAGGYGGLTTISTRELKQPTPTNDGLFLIEPSVTPVEPAKYGYIIDQVITHVIAKTPYKLSFFSEPETPLNLVTLNDMVWQGTYSAISMMTDNIRQWQNVMNLSNPLYEQGKYFTYPFNTPGVIPSGDRFIKVNIPVDSELLTFFNNSPSTINWKFPPLQPYDYTLFSANISAPDGYRLYSIEFDPTPKSVVNTFYTQTTPYILNMIYFESSLQTGTHEVDVCSSVWTTPTQGFDTNEKIILNSSNNWSKTFEFEIQFGSGSQQNCRISSPLSNVWPPYDPSSSDLELEKLNIKSYKSNTFNIKLTFDYDQPTNSITINYAVKNTGDQDAYIYFDGLYKDNLNVTLMSFYLYMSSITATFEKI